MTPALNELAQLNRRWLLARTERERMAIARDAELLAIEGHDPLRFGRLEVAGLVENVVGGQQHFLLLEEHAAIGDQHGGIRNGFAGLGGRVCGADVPDYRRDRQPRHQGRQRGAVVLHKRGPLEQVLRRIPAQAKLREDHQVGRGGAG